MDRKNNYCVIMAGGIGSRFWPMSRTAFPKQFIDILGTGQTLIQQTFDRLLKIAPKENILIVTNEMYQSLVLEQIDVKAEQILLEPSRSSLPGVAFDRTSLELRCLRGVGLGARRSTGLG